jgi:hypothetical protein
MKTVNNLFAFICLVLLLNSCEKKPNPITPTIASSGNVTLFFNNKVNGAQINMNGSFEGSNNLGQLFSIGTLKYYISNLRIVDSKGEEKSLGNFTLIDESKITPKHEIQIPNLTNGDYTKIIFDLGLDPATNALKDGKGDLDQSKGMWWNAEKYLFFKNEGKLKANNGAGFIFHVGNDANYIKNISIPIPNLMVNGNDKTVTIDLNLEKIYKDIDIETNSIMMSEPKFNAILVAYRSNAATAFSFNSIK